MTVDLKVDGYSRRGALKTGTVLAIARRYRPASTGSCRATAPPEAVAVDVHVDGSASGLADVRVA